MQTNKLVPELTVLDFQRAVHFYVDILGFHIEYRRTSPLFVYLNLESAQFMLEEFHGGAWITGELAPPLGRGVNFQIEVSDLKPILDRLAAAKHKLYREPREDRRNFSFKTRMVISCVSRNIWVHVRHNHALVPTRAFLWSSCSVRAQRSGSVKRRRTRRWLFTVFTHGQPLKGLASAGA
jgi:catechol 2,3-dioxygenase-like lactoylglutathione lyase family enzyme